MKVSRSATVTRSRVTAASMLVMSIILAPALVEAHRYARIDFEASTDDRPDTVCVLARAIARPPPSRAAPPRSSPPSVKNDPTSADDLRARDALEKLAVSIREPASTAPASDCADPLVCKPVVELLGSELTSLRAVCAGNSSGSAKGLVLVLRLDIPDVAVRGLSVAGTVVTLGFSADISGSFRVDVVGGHYARGSSLETAPGPNGAQEAHLPIRPRCVRQSVILPPRGEGWHGTAAVVVRDSDGDLVKCSTSLAGRSFELQVPVASPGRLKMMTIAPSSTSETSDSTWELFTQWSSSLPPIPLEVGWKRFGFGWNRSCLLPKFDVAAAAALKSRRRPEDDHHGCPDVSLSAATCRLAGHDDTSCSYSCDAKDGMDTRFPVMATFASSSLISWTAELSSAFERNASEPRSPTPLLVKLADEDGYDEIELTAHGEHYVVRPRDGAYPVYERYKAGEGSDKYIARMINWSCYNDIVYTYHGIDSYYNDHEAPQNAVLEPRPPSALESPLQFHIAAGVVRVSASKDADYAGIVDFSGLARTWRINDDLRILTGFHNAVDVGIHHYNVADHTVRSTGYYNIGVLGDISLQSRRTGYHASGRFGIQIGGPFGSSDGDLVRNNDTRAIAELGVRGPLFWLKTFQVELSLGYIIGADNYQRTADDAVMLTRENRFRLAFLISRRLK